MGLFMGTESRAPLFAGRKEKNLESITYMLSTAYTSSQPPGHLCEDALSHSVFQKRLSEG